MLLVTGGSLNAGVSGLRAGKITVEFDVEAQMRDGVCLRANVYRPDGPGPWPTLLVRTPYGKSMPLALSRLDPVRAAQAGFMVVIQDTRGRFASDGVWEPFRFEHEDGYDSVEWAAGLPYSNGRVGMYGASYHGNTQWSAAIERPPSLAAISPATTWSDPADGLFARGGAVELGLAIAWTLETTFSHVGRLPISRAERTQRAEKARDDYDALANRGYWALPIGADTIAGKDVVELGSLHARTDPDVVARCRVAGQYHEVTVPTFHTGGWYDLFLQGTLDNYSAMTEAGRDARLIVGPWTHTNFVDPIGEQIFGLRARRFGVPAHAHGDVNDLQFAWLRRHCDPSSEVELPVAPVRIFVMGRNEWRDETSWPPARAHIQRRFLRSDGSLAVEPPGPDDATTEFLYDPGSPAPTRAGRSASGQSFPRARAIRPESRNVLTSASSRRRACKRSSR